VQWHFTDSGTAAALRVRRGVAVPGSEDPAPAATLSLDLPTWARLYAGACTAADAEADGTLAISGERSALAPFFAMFDHPHLATAF
jgi:alkyl sulfatase BDS1-like metallo-beta-lactamase superfamily hydrolase